VFSNRFIFWMFLSDSSEVRVGSFVSFVGLFARSRAKISMDTAMFLVHSFER